MTVTTMLSVPDRSPARVGEQILIPVPGYFFYLQRGNFVGIQRKNKYPDAKFLPLV